MAGSYQHIIDEKNNFLGDEGQELLLDNLGDASEALEECYDMIQFLSGGDRMKIAEAHFAHLQKRCDHWKKENFTGKFVKEYWECD